MSVVDDWWYNLNLKKVLGDIGYFDPEMEQTWPQLAKVLADENHQFWISILKDGVPLALSFRVDYSTYRYLSEQGERKGIDLTKASDGNVAGAAWNCYRHDYEEAVGEKKRLKISVVFDGVNYSSPPIIDSQKTEALTTVAMEIEKRLLEKVAA